MKKFLILFISIFTISSSRGNPWRPTNIIAPEICQRLLRLGEKTFGLDSQPPVKIADGYFYACCTVATNPQIYINPQLFFPRNYGAKKGIIFHELIHAQQPLITQNNTRKLIPIHSEYSHVEREADIEAARHISCWKCAQEYANLCLALYSLDGRTYINHVTRKGYASSEMIAPLVQAKKEIGDECDYHKTLRSHTPYILSHFITPLIMFGLIRPIPHHIWGYKFIMAGGFFYGLTLEFFIQEEIRKTIESKVASGELEP